MKTKLILITTVSISLSIVSCVVNRTKQTITEKDTVEKVQEIGDTIPVTANNDENISESEESTISTWSDVADILNKKYKVKGIWTPTKNYSSNLVIYSKKGKYYLSECEISENPLSDSEQMRLTKKGNTFMYKGDGDMPEKFIINGNQLDSYTYNPDVSEWVYMESYQNVY
jgi:hypothetical protein